MNEFQDYLDRYKILTDKTKKLLFITVDIELQKSTLDELNTLIIDTIAWKEYGIKGEDENLANQQLAFEYILKALYAEMVMWINLKEDKMNAAWDNLIDAQSYCRTAIQAHKLAEPSETYATRLLNIEKLIFPSQIFTSPGFLVKKARCSICNKDYAVCDHIVGRPYMGQICSKIIEDAHLLEVSIVIEPASKKARITTISDDDGNKIDYLTQKKIND